MKKTLFKKNKFKTLRELYEFCQSTFICDIDIDNHIVVIFNAKLEPINFKVKVNLGGWYMEQIE